MGHDTTEFLRKGLFEASCILTNPRNAYVDLPHDRPFLGIVESEDVGEGVVAKVFIVQIGHKGIRRENVSEGFDCFALP